MENMRGVVRNAIFLAWVIKNRMVQVKLSRMKHADAEKVRHHRVDRQRFPRSPEYGQSVI